jgi:flagellar biosynthetic protein FlhB
MAGERTEQATQHRREKARLQGDILHSRELTGAAATLAGAMMLGVMGTRSMEVWRDTFAGFLSLGEARHWEPTEMLPTLIGFRRLSLELLTPVGMLMVAVAAAALAVAVLQTGGIQVHPQALAFKPERVNPAANVKNLFSLRALARLGKSLVPAALLMVFAVQRIAHETQMPPFSMARIEAVGGDVYGLLLAAAWLLFGWAAVDYAVEWQSRESRLKMSKQDLREEHKETEGSPQIKSRIRSLQRQMRRKRVKEDVARAAVVITNPTHYAVALGFDFGTMEATKVLAKGRNLLAEEIKAEARWAGVPVLENPPLARSLYRSVEIGQSIPVDLYQTVASILAWLYKQRVEQELREKKYREAQAKAARATAQQAAQTAQSLRNMGANLPGREIR